MAKKPKNKYKEYDSERDISGRTGGDYGHYLADMLLFEQEIEAGQMQSELEKIIMFIRKSDNMGLNPDKKFENRYEKQILLTEYGYFISEKDSDFKVGSMFNNFYASAKKKLTNSKCR
jgi:hypothetical protein